MSLIDNYISGFSIEIQNKLYEIYHIVKEAVPKETSETIKWNMPTFCLNGNLVHFSAEKKHIGFHPGNSAIDKFKEKLEGLKFSKGTIQFNYDKPLPRDLIQEIITFRVNEQLNNQ